MGEKFPEKNHYVTRERPRRSTNGCLLGLIDGASDVDAALASVLLPDHLPDVHEPLCGRAELAHEEDVHLVRPEVEETRPLVQLVRDEESARSVLERERASTMSSRCKTLQKHHHQSSDATKIVKRYREFERVTVKKVRFILLRVQCVGPLKALYTSPPADMFIPTPTPLF